MSGLASIFAPGKRDSTTRETAKLDRQDAIVKTMALNPWWVPVDGIGHRVCVDPKTKRLKRDVTANATAVVASSAGGAAARSSSSHALVGESARREFCKPIQSHAAEFERLASLGIGFDPNTRYVMDAPKARIARSYISGTSSGSGVVVEICYDHDTHVASRSGYTMFGGGVGFVHTNGAVSREAESCAEQKACPCGFVHVF